MNPDFYRPFIQSTKNAFETLAEIEVVDLLPSEGIENIVRGDIAGIVGFAEAEVTGCAILSFPRETALFIYRKIMGEELLDINVDVFDIIGELTNIVVGGAKVILSKIGITYHISVPSVVEGENHEVTHQPDTEFIIIPFRIDDNLNFSLQVSKKKMKIPFRTSKI